MANIGLGENDYSLVKSITLVKNLYLEFGAINNSAPSVDPTVVTTTTLFTVPVGITGVDIYSLKFRLFGANTTGTMVASIGTNSTSYNNIMPSTTFTGFNSIDDLYMVPLSGKVVRAFNTNVITMKVTTSMTGPGATVEVWMMGEVIP